MPPTQVGNETAARRLARDARVRWLAVLACMASLALAGIVVAMDVSGRLSENPTRRTAQWQSRSLQHLALGESGREVPDAEGEPSASGKTATAAEAAEPRGPSSAAADVGDVAGTSGGDPEPGSDAHATAAEPPSSASRGQGNGLDRVPTTRHELPMPPEAPSDLVVTSGEMRDELAWTPSEGPPHPWYYEVLSADGPDGPFEIVAEIDGTSAAIDVDAAASRYYAVRGVFASRRGEECAPVANDLVAMSAQVGPGGALLRSSNGEVELAFPAGAFPSSTTVAVTEADGPEARGLLRLAGVYDIEPSGALGAPATLRIRYELSVPHAQVADTVLAAAELMTFDPSAGMWVAGSADATARDGWLEGTLTHFSYWSGASIQPHGTTPAKTSYCDGICHNLLAAPGSPDVIPNRDPQVCFFCHGNVDSTDAPAGASGPNVEAAFLNCDDQVFNPANNSRHPAATSTADWMACVDCHDPHRDPASEPGLLRAYDAVTGKARRSGNAFCFSCHGTRASARIEAAVPGYYSRTGGDKKTGWTGNAHATSIAATGAAGSKCAACHAEHGSTNRSLVATGVAGSPVTTNDTIFNRDNSLCYACHTSSLRTYPGKATYAAAVHGPAGCKDCHDPHGVPGIPSLLASVEEANCYGCHAGGSDPPCNQCHQAGMAGENPNIEEQMDKTLRVPVQWAVAVQVDDRGTNPYGVSLGDLDGDGDLDIACGGYDFELVWYENTAGDGSAWFERSAFTATSTVYTTRIRDLDGDGDQDIISGTAWGDDYRVRFHENVDGDGTSWSETVIWAGSGGTSAGIWALDVEDVDDDDDLDVVHGGYRVGLYYNENVDGDASAWSTTQISTERATAARIADMDADGDGDVVSGDFNAGGRLYYHENTNGDGSAWGSVQFFDGGSKTNWLDVGDLDGDLTPDVVATFDTSTGDNHRTRAFLNTAGDASVWTTQTVFDWSTWATTYYNPTVVRVADVSGDGALDVLTSNENEHIYQSEDRYPHSLEWWSTYAVRGPGYRISTMDTGDVDGDGDVDIVYGGKAGPFGPILFVSNEGRPPGASGSHPVASFTGRHAASETSAAVGAANRHAECADCHDPHMATAGVHTLGDNTAPGVLDGVAGVSVNNLAPWAPPLYTEVDQVLFEYELCFRCHSSYTTGYTGSDKAKSFNALNASFHPIEAVGTNMGVRDDAFTLGTPWNPTAGDDADYGFASPKMTCTDCHASDRGSEPRGPHGSEWPTLLRGNFTSGDQADYSEAGVCWICHDFETYYAGGYGGPSRIPHGHFWNYGAFCTDCHDVHGSDQPHLMSRLYSHTASGGVIDLTGWTDCSDHHGSSKEYESEY